MAERPETGSAARVEDARTRGLVLRNATWLAAAQFLVAPVSLLVNIAMARYLGAADFGYIYVAATLCSFGFLAVDWGGSTALPSLVARDRAGAGALLGSALAWRAATAVAVFGLLAGLCRVLGFDGGQRTAVYLIALALGLGALARACQDAIRGFERTDFAAYGTVGQALLVALLVIPTLRAGGGLGAALAAQAAAAGIGLAAVATWLRPAGVRGLSVRRAALAPLLAEGSPFLLLGAVLALQTNVDALMLSRLAPSEVMGWQAAALKLVGGLSIPANALITSLYPTLYRLHAADPDAYRSTARAGLKAGALLAVPIALGCALYPRLGVWLFSERSFGPAADNLRVLAPYVLLLYLTIPLGCCLSAAGRQRAWALGQLGCVAVSLVLDPLLIPLFQTRTGNGGLGVGVAMVASEVLMLALALALAPRGLVDRAVLRSLGLALAAGGGMVLAARLCSGLNPLAAASVSLAAYAGCLWALNAVDRPQVARLRAMVFPGRR